jgi:Alpha amylase, catalytic domain
MSFSDTILGQARPSSVRAIDLPRRQKFFPSPADWRDEVIYFLLPDRFSDGQENGRARLDRSNLAAARPEGFRFDQWAQSGGDRYQGGTIAGITSKLDYLRNLGVTTLWSARPSNSAGTSTPSMVMRSRTSLRSIRDSVRGRMWLRSWMQLTARTCASSSTSFSTTPAAIGFTQMASASHRFYPSPVLSERRLVRWQWQVGQCPPVNRGGLGCVAERVAGGRLLYACGWSELRRRHQ